MKTTYKWQQEIGKKNIKAAEPEFWCACGGKDQLLRRATR